MSREWRVGFSAKERSEKYSLGKISEALGAWKAQGVSRETGEVGSHVLAVAVPGAPARDAGVAAGAGVRAQRCGPRCEVHESIYSVFQVEAG